MFKIRKIIHIDMDAFYASVEQRDAPELIGLPVIVGGKPQGRGVVAACSYEARQYGIHSAMPSAEAYRRCPTAVFIRPRFSVYQSVSREVQSVFREYTEFVEPLSLDEAYLDVTEVSLFGGSAIRIAEDIRRSILKQTGLVASAGISYNKFLAKIASDFDKPDGCHCILPADGAAFVAELPIKRFYGVGKATESRMHALGIQTGADLRRWSMTELNAEFGKSADYYYHAARGIDHRPVRVERSRKSFGAERTFGENLTTFSAMLEVLVDLSNTLLLRLEDRDTVATTVSVKLRYADFTTLTRTHKLSLGVMTPAIASRTIPFLLQRALQQKPRRGRAEVRLLGVSFSGLLPCDNDRLEQLDLNLDD